MRILIFLVLAGVVLFTPRVGRSQSAAVEVLSRKQFQSVASKLDVGGDFFLVVNTDKLLQRIFDAARNADVGMPADDPHEKEVRETIGCYKGFLVRNGFAAVHGAGVSSVPLDDGSSSVKFYLSRDYIDSSLPLWRGLVGWQPRRLLSLDFIPSDCVMVRAGTPEAASLWKVVESAVSEIADDEGRKRFEAGKKRVADAVGLAPGELMGSLSDEFLFAVRFSKTEQSSLPVGGGVITIPAPSFLLVLGVKNDILRGVMEAWFGKRNIALNENMVGDVMMRSSSTDIPMPVPFRPSYASTAGFLILGTTPEVVADALLAYRHKNGLISRPEFKSAFQGLSMVNNGILYIADEMGQVLGHIRDSKLQKALGAGGEHPAAERVLREFMTYGGKSLTASFIIQNWKNGVIVMGRSSVGGQEALMRFLVKPMGMARHYFAKSKLWATLGRTLNAE